MSSGVALVEVAPSQGSGLGTHHLTGTMEIRSQPRVQTPKSRLDTGRPSLQSTCSPASLPPAAQPAGCNRPRVPGRGGRPGSQVTGAPHAGEGARRVHGGAQGIPHKVRGDGWGWRPLRAARPSRGAPSRDQSPRLQGRRRAVGKGPGARRDQAREAGAGSPGRGRPFPQAAAGSAAATAAGPGRGGRGRPRAAGGGRPGRAMGASSARPGSHLLVRAWPRRPSASGPLRPALGPGRPALRRASASAAPAAPGPHPPAPAAAPPLPVRAAPTVPPARGGGHAGGGGGRGTRRGATWDTPWGDGDTRGDTRGAGGHVGRTRGENTCGAGDTRGYGGHAGRTRVGDTGVRGVLGSTWEGQGRHGVTGGTVGGRRQGRGL